MIRLLLFCSFLFCFKQSEAQRSERKEIVQALSRYVEPWEVNLTKRYNNRGLRRLLQTSVMARFIEIEEKDTFFSRLMDTVVIDSVKILYHETKNLIEKTQGKRHFYRIKSDSINSVIKMSMPLFSVDGRSAIVFVVTARQSTCQYGETFVFKKKNNVWVYHDRFFKFVS